MNITETIRGLEEGERKTFPLFRLPSVRAIASKIGKDTGKRVACWVEGGRVYVQRTPYLGRYGRKPRYDFNGMAVGECRTFLDANKRSIQSIASGLRRKGWRVSLTFDGATAIVWRLG